MYICTDNYSMTQLFYLIILYSIYIWWSNYIGLSTNWVSIVKLIKWTHNECITISVIIYATAKPILHSTRCVQCKGRVWPRQWQEVSAASICIFVFINTTMHISRLSHKQFIQNEFKLIQFNTCLNSQLFWATEIISICGCRWQTPTLLE